MNTKENMIIAGGKIITPRIKKYEYNKVTKKIDVQFNDGKNYSYNYNSIKWLKNPTILEERMVQVSKDGQIFNNIEYICVFKDNYKSYFHICFKNGTSRDYLENELEITLSCLYNVQAKNVLEYIKNIASLNELRNEITDRKLLEEKFDKIDVIGNDIALAKYLNPDLKTNNKYIQNYIPIFPFGCNNSQYKAVKNAMENQFSIIQGPPGTGKTQTILNIISNILIQGRTVQVVSNNNAAIENVYEKLSSPEYELDFIVAPLGSYENKQKFINAQEGLYPEFMKNRDINKNINKSLLEIKEKSLQLKNIFDKQEELALLKDEYSQLLIEKKYFDKYVEESSIDYNLIIIKRKLSSGRWLNLWYECKSICKKRKKLSLLGRFKFIFKYQIINAKFYKQDISKMITIIQANYYKAKEKELSDRIFEIDSYLKKNDTNLLDDLCNNSMDILKDILAKKCLDKESRIMFEQEDLWKSPREVLEEYPVVLSTTFSSRNSLSDKIIYDYLIMDEASQVDIVTGALALSCAKNVIIVGDTKQLPNVVTQDVRDKAQAIFDKYQVSEGYKFTNSFLKSIIEVMPSVPQVLLREHYRCHPKIINFCNQKFYRGELVIMTQDNGEDDVIGVIKTVEGNHERDHYSQRQIDVIKNEIVPKYVDNRKETGIITPYNKQVNELKKEFDDIDVATVHKFQGREKDTIIISTVDDEISEFVDDPYLINVAVSRAKKKLWLVVSGNNQTKESNIKDLIEYIEYNNFQVVDSKIYSVFDYLYKQYSKQRKLYLQNYKKISEYESENLMYSVIEDILAADKYAHLSVVTHVSLNTLIRNTELLDKKEYRYVSNPATHLDFLIYNRISKKPVLAIEADGYDYHKPGTVQYKRDRMKDHVMQVYGIELVRCMTNGSEEREKVEKMLDRLC